MSRDLQVRAESSGNGASANGSGQYDFDLFTIGAGSGGVRAARFAASTFGDYPHAPHPCTCNKVLGTTADPVYCLMPLHVPPSVPAGLVSWSMLLGISFARNIRHENYKAQESRGSAQG